jgi:hypothetical protein
MRRKVAAKLGTVREPDEKLATAECRGHILNNDKGGNQ